MGDSIRARRFTRQDRARFREQVQRGLEALEIMLGDGWFEEASQPQLGLEIELNLVDGDRNPAMTNEQVLDAIANPGFQTELGRFNVEINVAPRPLGGDSLAELERFFETIATIPEHATWGKKLEPFVVSGTSRWSILRVVPTE